MTWFRLLEAPELAKCPDTILPASYRSSMIINKGVLC